MNSLKLFYNYLSKSKVDKQLYITYICSILIPIAFIGVFLLFNTKSLLEKHYKQLVYSDNLRVKSILFDVTTNFYNISQNISTDISLYNLLQTDYEDSSAAQLACDNYKTISNYIITTPAIESIQIYHSNSTLTSSNHFKCISDPIKQTDWYKQSTTQPEIFWKSTPRTDLYNNTYWELTLYQRIPLVQTHSFAILEMRISYNYLKNLIQNNDLFNILSINQDPIFFSSNRRILGQTLPFNIDYSKYFFKYAGNLIYNESSYLGYISSFMPYRSNDLLYISTLDFSALKSTRHIIYLCIFILSIGLIAPIPIIIEFTRYFSKRINTLREAMHMTTLNQYDFEHDFNGDDEISATFNDLKLMIKKIKEKDAKMYEDKINHQTLVNEQQQMEFKMLANQINPHFLYNTLETIRMQAFNDGNKQIATSIKLLGKSMHYVLENTGTVSTTLQKELDYIQTYIAIQKLRFGDNLSYTLCCEENLDPQDYPILPLLLQPIVENAIFHGLDDLTEQGEIIISIKKEDNAFLSIDIYDKGKGIPKEKLEALNHAIQLTRIKPTSSIGLYNINQRIKLYYGSNYGLTITSTVSQGTHVILHLPLPLF